MGWLTEEKVMSYLLKSARSKESIKRLEKQLIKLKDHGIKGARISRLRMGIGLYVPAKSVAKCKRILHPRKYKRKKRKS